MHKNLVKHGRRCGNCVHHIHMIAENSIIVDHGEEPFDDNLFYCNKIRQFVPTSLKVCLLHKVRPYCELCAKWVKESGAKEIIE